MDSLYHKNPEVYARKTETTLAIKNKFYAKLLIIKKRKFSKT